MDYLTVTLTIGIVLLALAFEYINGFHDSANAIATVVSTKVLSPRTAVIYGAFFNFAGAFFGTHVAHTIGSGLVNSGSVTQSVIICALFSAIIWNLITWYFGLPSSSSHALIGGLLGSAIVSSGFSIVNLSGLIEKVLLPMILSPIIGLFVGFTFMVILTWIFRKSSPDKTSSIFRKLQLVSSGVMAFGHGSNDAQKTMGIITLTLFSSGFLKTFNVPIWVILMCAVIMAMGTLAGGWKIIRTMGSKVIKLRPVHGFAAETSATAVILTASHFGMPISTTHVISSTIMGVGSAQRNASIKWGVANNMVIAWILTIPFCMLLSACIEWLLGLFMRF